MARPQTCCQIRIITKCFLNMVDIHQSPQYANFLSSSGWIIEKICGVNYFIRNLPLFGSILKIQRPKEIYFDEIDRLCQKYHVFQTILEPSLFSTRGDFTTFDHNLLLHHGFRLSKSPYLPSKTLQIDLTKSQKDIEKGFMRNIRTGIKRGEGFLTKSYSTPRELEIFRNAWEDSVKLSRFVPSLQTLINLRKSFPDNYSLFLASHNISGRIIGGVIFTRCLHNSVNYMYGFMSQEGRTSLTHAGLLYQGILWGKEMNCKIFDFEGIYDERFPNKSWLGFTRFKESFGGSEVIYPGCYTKLSLLNSLGRI